MFQWLLSYGFENVNLFLWPCLFVPFTVFHTHIADLAQFCQGLVMY